MRSQESEAGRGAETGEANPSAGGRRRLLPQALKVAAWGVPALVVLALAGFVLRQPGSQEAASFSAADFRAKSEVERFPAPDFELPLLDGSGSLSLSALRGHVVVLNFWASWCRPCREEAPDLQATWDAYRDRGVRFLGVVERDAESAARAFVDEFGITYPSVFDPSGQLADDYGFLGLPTTYIVDPEGQVVYRFTGYLDGPALRGALEDVLRR